MILTLVAGILTLAALAVGVASLVYLHAVPSGLSPFSHPVSEYGITKYRNGYRTAAVSFGVSGIGAGVALAASLGQAASLTIFFLGVFAVSRLAIGWYPMDAMGTRATRTGVTHNLLAFATFGSATAAGFVVRIPLHDSPDWSSFETLSTTFAIVMLAGSLLTIATGAIPGTRRWFGALERVIYLGIIAWLALIGIASILVST